MDSAFDRDSVADVVGSIVTDVERDNARGSQFRDDIVVLVLRNSMSVKEKYILGCF